MPKSNRIRHRMAAVLATGLAGLALAGTASAVDLRDWGRTFPASQRFVVLSQFKNQAVLDKETQLVWERTPQGSGTGAQAAMMCLQRATGGRKGWRLPSIHELLSLIDPSMSADTNVNLPLGHPFTVAGDWHYRSSTRSIHVPGAFYVVTLSTGIVNIGDASNHNVWCVRGGGPISEY